MKLLITGYVPPPTYPGAPAFMENLMKHRPGTEMLLFSDHPYPFVSCPQHQIVRPEAMNKCLLNVCDAGGHVISDAAGKPIRRPYAISNALFHCALRWAVKGGYSHFIYIESDCRFGPDWDSQMWEEYFRLPFPPIAAGTLVSYNAPFGGLEYVRRWKELMARDTAYPILSYSAPSGTDGKPSLFPNGALGIYRTDWLAKLFDITSLTKTVHGKAWDYQLGLNIHERFGLEAFDQVAHLNTICSAYGEEVTNEQTRLQWLAEGRFKAVHQVKGKR